MANLVSIVIPNWNTTKELESCVTAIHKSNLSIKYEIIVIDNASEDWFYEWKAMHPEVKVIQNDINLGFSISIVQGLLISKGRYVCFLNSDTEPAEHWLDYLVEYLELDPKCGLVAPAAYNVCRPEQAPGFNKGENVEVREVIPFMCVVIPKRIFCELGLPVIRYGEDVEYCNRIRGHGYKTVVVGKAFVVHLGSQCWVVNKIGRNQFVQINFAKEVIEKRWLGELDSSAESESIVEELKNKERRKLLDGV